MSGRAGLSHPDIQPRAFLLRYRSGTTAEGGINIGDQVEANCCIQKELDAVTGWRRCLILRWRCGSGTSQIGPQYLPRTRDILPTSGNVPRTSEI